MNVCFTKYLLHLPLVSNSNVKLFSLVLRALFQRELDHSTRIQEDRKEQVRWKYKETDQDIDLKITVKIIKSGVEDRGEGAEQIIIVVVFAAINIII